MNSTPAPALLEADNFTPATRTPWGGTRILSQIKREFSGRRPADDLVGESWELSVEPDFPSVTHDGRSLDAIIRAEPHAWLGAAAARLASTELLVKLVDAADDLSIQIHPDDTYEALDPGYGGKPEAWYVVDALPDACLYLGLAQGADAATLASAIALGADVSQQLTRVPVARGDFFVIEPGTAHAIGRGCLIVEPQRVSPGRKGVTYRFWDWNRRYDSSGRPDPHGALRTLHVDHALAVTRFDAPRGDAMLARVRSRLGDADLSGAARRTDLCGPVATIRSRDLEVSRVEGSGNLLFDEGPFRALTVLEGSVEIHVGAHRLGVQAGQSAAIPAGRVEFALARAHAIVSAVP